MTKEAIETNNDVQEKTKEHFAQVLRALYELRGDLAFLNEILQVAEDNEDERRKVQLAVPFLDSKVIWIEDMLADYRGYAAPELKEKLQKPENQLNA